MTTICNDPSPDGRWRCERPEGHFGVHESEGPPTHPRTEPPPLIENSFLFDYIGCWWGQS